jgi:hypothetical protein
MAWEGTSDWDEKEVLKGSSVLVVLKDGPNHGRLLRSVGYTDAVPAAGTWEMQVLGNLPQSLFTREWECVDPQLAYLQSHTTDNTVVPRREITVTGSIARAKSNAIPTPSRSCATGRRRLRPDHQLREVGR